MLHLPPAHHETSKHDSPNETKIKEKQNKAIPDLNSNLTKSMTHHNQTKELTTWFLNLFYTGRYDLSEIQIQQLVEFPTTVTRKPLTIWSCLMDHRKAGRVDF
jgi:hypothetical protein